MDRRELIDVINAAYEALHNGEDGEVRRILQQARESFRADEDLFKDISPLFCADNIGRYENVDVTLVEQVYINGLYIDLEATTNEGDVEGPHKIEGKYRWEDAVGDEVSADQLTVIKRKPQWLIAAIFGNTPDEEVIAAIESGAVELSFVNNLPAFVAALKAGNVYETDMSGFISFYETESSDT